MEKTVTYLGVEKIVYKFEKHEVQQALMEYFKIPWSRERYFEMYEGYEEDDPYAELVVKYTKEKDADKNSKND